MSKSWYQVDKGNQLFSGLESSQNSELETIFRQMVISADNGYSITINRYNDLPHYNVINQDGYGVIVQSSVTSKYGEKLILFAKGELVIGDIVNYKGEKYLISNFVNEDISMNDSAPMHLCNATASYHIEEKTELEERDSFGRIQYDIQRVDRTIYMVFDTLKYTSDSDYVINSERDIVECWIQYNNDIMNSINKEINIYKKTYTIEGISRDLLKYNLDYDEYFGVLRLRLKVKE